MRWLHVAIAVALTGCLQLETGGDGGAAAGGSSGSASGSGSGSSGSGGTGATSGTGCTTDPASQITLCEQIANCPGVDVDQGAFPGCGFRMNAASTYDLECACGDSLCPIGVPGSCSDAAQLLEQAQSSLSVCQQLDQGSCLPIAVDGGGGAPSSTGSTCDKTCESECAGDPNCIQMCGC